MNIEAKESKYKISSKTIAIVLGIICTLLVASFVGLFAIYTSTINGKNQKISDLQKTVLSLNNTLTAINKSNSLIRGIKITATPYSRETILSEGANEWGDSGQLVQIEARENVTLTLHNFGETDTVAIVLIYTEVNGNYDYSIETILVTAFSNADVTSALRGTLESSVMHSLNLSYGYLILES